MRGLDWKGHCLPFAVLCVMTLFFAACDKSNNSVTAPYNPGLTDSIDTHSIDTFVQNRQGTQFDSVFLHPTRSDSTVLQYQIIPAGNVSIGPNFPTLDSAVTFNYTIRELRNPNKIIDSVGFPGFTVSPLSETIPALYEGLQLLKKNQRILLFVPSSLGFRDHPTDVTYNLLTGQQVTTIVPANSVLIFDVRLTNIIRLDTTTSR